MLKKIMACMLVFGLTAPLSAGISVDDLPEVITKVVHAAPVVLPGVIAGFLVQTKIQNPTWYAHAAGLLASMYVTVCTAENYFESQNSHEHVSEYKQSAETACVGACLMYGLGVAAGSVWNDSLR